ncbi:MAG: DNA/RNA non-specific endonuclease [Oceanococcus sp.]
MKSISILILLASPLLLSAWVLFNGVRSDDDSYAGLPRSQTMQLLPWEPTWFHVVDPPGFVLGYSEWLKNPLWVAYRLDGRVSGKPGARPSHFSEDAATLMRVNADDYVRSGFDRGHLAPNYAMSRFHGRAAQLASFRMSNIVPQQPALNQKLWQRLEEIEADVYAKQQGPLWVVTGPIFSAEHGRLKSGVAIPAAFFRIWLRQSGDGEVQALAFVVPQQVKGYEPLDQYLVTVDAVKAQTGLDFFHQLPDQQEAIFESSLYAAAWGFAQHAQRPPRY